MGVIMIQKGLTKVVAEVKARHIKAGWWESTALKKPANPLSRRINRKRQKIWVPEHILKVQPVAEETAAVKEAA